MKKMIAFGMSLIMILSLTACGRETPSTAAPTETTATAAPSESSTAAAPTASSSIAAPTEASSTAMPTEVLTTVAPTEPLTTVETTEIPATEAPTAEPAPGAKILSYEEYLAAEEGSEVTIESYIQLASYIEPPYGNISLFLQDEVGAYYVFRMEVTPEEAALLTEGTKIRVNGFKDEWEDIHRKRYGEVMLEPGKSTFNVVEDGDTYIAEAADVTALFGTDELIGYMNRKVSIKGAVVVASVDWKGNEKPFLYGRDGSSWETASLFFNVSLGGKTYTMTVYCDEWQDRSEVYEAVEALSVGDKIDISAFLFWHDGPEPHVFAIKAAD